VVAITNPDKIESSIAKAEAHAHELQDIISLSPGSWGPAYKKALLARLELQYALTLLKLERGTHAQAPKTRERTIDLERALVRLSSHMSKALQLYRQKVYGECASELYAADALDSKIIPKLRKEKKG
jgi:hypothetical protein